MRTVTASCTSVSYIPQTVDCKLLFNWNKKSLVRRQETSLIIRMGRGYVAGAGGRCYLLEEIINSHLYRMVFLFICQEDRAWLQVPSSSQPRIEAARQDYVCVWKSQIFGTKALHKWQVKFFPVSWALTVTLVTCGVSFHLLNHRHLLDGGLWILVHTWLHHIE